MNLCPRHDDALVMALELRGLLRPTLSAEADVTPLVFARAAIREHASNFVFALAAIREHASNFVFARAAVELLQRKACPICFVNQQTRAGVNVDGWVNDAAEEALERDLARQDESHTSLVTTEE